mmetsp:Transcript_3380/g.7567  ORF Transcript_3380/g.7567 Transcript_3380/m.7567 type:complete len:108 (+) Transcript_3380:69-392(+)
MVNHKEEILMEVNLKEDMVLHNKVLMVNNKGMVLHNKVDMDNNLNKDMALHNKVDMVLHNQEVLTNILLKVVLMVNLKQEDMALHNKVDMDNILLNKDMANLNMVLQ